MQFELTVCPDTWPIVLDALLGTEQSPVIVLEENFVHQQSQFSALRAASTGEVAGGS